MPTLVYPSTGIVSFITQAPLEVLPNMFLTLAGQQYTTAYESVLQQSPLPSTFLLFLLSNCRFRTFQVHGVHIERNRDVRVPLKGYKRSDQ
jgi:hypothetical protein